MALALVMVLVFWARDSLEISSEIDVNAGLSASGLAVKTVSVNGIDIQAELAETPVQKILGLSNRQSLKEGRGMLFVYGKPGRQRFWMKDMHFPIDIIWIDGEKVAVHLEREVMPDSYPEVFSPPVLAQYVLEVPAGYSERVGIVVGSRFLWKN